ncbi:MAG: hypothetical protein P8M34_07605, partial [Saprospiraceae bacterium]|nr:hypothetical protein [Saprospiraceae bacterium]
MGKILIMGQIPDDFNVDKHIALGPFCFLGKENIYPKWEQIKFIPDPFDTPESLFENNKKLVLFTLKIIPELIAFLNKEKCTNKSELFWKPILYPWLYSFLETLWERQNRLINFVNAHKNNEISVRLITSNFKWSFIDTLDFQSEGIMNILFNEWLFSRIIEENLPKKWNAIYIDKSNECNLARKSKVDPRKENFLKEKIINELSKYGFNEIYGLNLKEQFEFNRAVKKRKGKKVNLHSTNEKILDEIANVTALEWKFDYKTILYECMPDSILETDIKWAFEKAKGKQLYFVSSSILFGDNRIKPLIGAIREMGGKVISVQHGGHPYGTGGSYYLAQGNEYINDGFITWGWEEQNDFIGNFIPLSSPMLSKLENKHIEQNDELIFISTLPRMISHRLQSTPQPVQQLEYMAFKKYFLSTLDGDIIKNFRYR